MLPRGAGATVRQGGCDPAVRRAPAVPAAVPAAAVPAAAVPAAAEDAETACLLDWLESAGVRLIEVQGTWSVPVRR